MTAGSRRAVRSDCVRASVHGTSALKPDRNSPDLARTRAIAPEGAVAQDPEAKNFRAKIRNAASLTVAETFREQRHGWFTDDRITTFGDVCGEILPSKEEVAHWYRWPEEAVAGLFRAAVVGGCWLVIASVSTRLRAKVGVVVFLLSAAAGLVVHFSA